MPGFSCLLTAFAIFSSDTTYPVVQKNIPEKQPTIVMPSTDEDMLFFEEEMPIFPGGEKALESYLKKNTKYPAAALKAKVERTVFIQFTVDKTGLIRNVHPVGRYKGYGMEAEAIRVVCRMPKWKPAKMGGKFVDVLFNLPIRFSMPGLAKDPLTRHSYILPSSK